MCLKRQDGSVGDIDICDCGDVYECENVYVKKVSVVGVKHYVCAYISMSFPVSVRMYVFAKECSWC